MLSKAKAKTKTMISKAKAEAMISKAKTEAVISKAKARPRRQPYVPAALPMQTMDESTFTKLSINLFSLHPRSQSGNNKGEQSQDPGHSTMGNYS